MFKEREKSQLVYDEAKKLGYSNLVAEITSKRVSNPSEVKSILSPTIDDVPSLDRLVDSDKAALIIYNHLKLSSHIVCITDSDSDGVSCAAVMDRSILEYFHHDEENLTVIVNERKFGNGVNKEMIGRTLELHKNKPVGLVITADHGSSDDERFEILKKQGIDVVVTDHHLLPETGELKFADAFVNPQRESDTFSNHISGCSVIYFVMQRVYDLFVANGDRLLRTDRLDYLLPIMAVTILSDRMDLSSPINRYYLKRGMDIMGQSTDPIWVALRQALDVDANVSEETISFLIAPLLNAANRTGKAYMAYDYLTSKDLDEAIIRLKKLIDLNNQRKHTEAEMLAVASVGSKQYPYSNSLVSLLPYGLGVAGLVSQTLGDRLQVPAITFVEHEDGFLVGSARGVKKNFHLKNAFDNIAIKDPTIIIKKGGHAGAAGCTINGDKIKEFMKLFDEEVIEQLSGEVLTIEHLYDFEIPLNYIGDSLFDEIKKAGPYGQGYPIPAIKVSVLLDSFFYVGKPPIHSILKLYTLDRLKMFKSFYPKSSSVPLRKFKNKQCDGIVTLSKKRYLGKYEVNITTQYIEPHK